MSELDKIKTGRSAPNTWLEGVNFDFSKSEENPLGPHIHLVSEAASSYDEPLLLKSKEDLSEEEMNILDKVNKKTTKQKENVMGEEVNKALEQENEDLKKQLEELTEIRKELKKTKVEKSLKDFEFEEDVLKDVVEVMVDMDEEVVSVITKAFTMMKEYKEPEEENELLKSLSNEAGIDGETEIVQKTKSQKLNDDLSAAREKLYKK